MCGRQAGARPRQRRAVGVGVGVGGGGIGGPRHAAWMLSSSQACLPDPQLSSHPPVHATAKGMS